MQNKDPNKSHFYISMIKSAIRFFAGGALYYGQFAIAGSLIIAAEILGVLEEIV